MRVCNSLKNKKKPHRNAAIVKNQSGSVTPKENEFNYLSHCKYFHFTKFD